MKALYVLLLFSLMSFASEPPADKTPRIGQSNEIQEQEQQTTSIKMLTDAEIARAYRQAEIQAFIESNNTFIEYLKNKNG